MGRIKKAIAIKQNKFKRIPGGYLEHLESSANGSLVIDEAARQLESGEIVEIPEPSSRVTTYGDWVLSYRGGEDYRPGDALSFSAIKRMLRDGAVLFALEMKRAEIFRVFSEGRYKVTSPDKELAQVAEAALNLIITRMADDITWAGMAYGAYHAEMTFDFKSKYQLGLSAHANAKGTKFWVPNTPGAIHPETIKQINRDPDTFEYEGFTQEGKNFLKEIPVPVGRALTIPVNSHFRNLHGNPVLTPAYPLFVWKDVTMRIMARWLDRMATPVVVGKAPMHGSVTLSDESTAVRPMKLALHLASSLAKSNAVAIPSDTDERGNPLWSLEYLTSPDKSQPFISTLEYFSQEILRAILTADRAVSQPSVSSGGTGSEAIGRVHSAASSMASEMILLQILYFINKYFMPWISYYNRGADGPPIRMRVQPITSREFDLLSKLMSVAGNSPASQEFYTMIDWRLLAETSSVPLLSPEELAKKKKELQEEAEAKMLAQKKVFDQSAKDKGEGDPPAGGGPPPSEKPALKKAEELEHGQIVEALLSGDHSFLALSPDDLIRLGVDKESIKLLNPYSGPGKQS